MYILVVEDEDKIRRHVAEALGPLFRVRHPACAAPARRGSLDSDQRIVAALAAL